MNSIRLAEKARDKKLSIDDMRGGSIYHFKSRRSWRNKFFSDRQLARSGYSRRGSCQQWNQNMSKRATLHQLLCCRSRVSYDHRLIDGADGARFLRWVADAIEQPFLMELDNK
jgi:pyruvate dehydrogenase E2 component (dihydrolipoamide acetyltransferase)